MKDTKIGILNRQIWRLVLEARPYLVLAPFVTMSFFGLFGPPNVVRMKAKGDIQGLVKALSYKDMNVQKAATKALVAMLEAYRLGDWKVKDATLEALVKLGKPAVELLVAVLNGPGWYVRSDVATALGQIGDPRAVGPLIGALGDSDEYVRAGAAEALGRIGDARAVEPLLKVLKDYPPRVNKAVAQALVLLHWQPTDDTQRATMAVALEEWDEAVSIGAPAVEALMSELHDRMETTYKRQEKAAEALGKIGDPRAVESLITMVLSERVRPEGHPSWAAAEVLGRIGDPRAVPRLLEKYNQRTYQNKNSRHLPGSQPRLAAATLLQLGRAAAEQLVGTLTASPCLDEDAADLQWALEHYAANIETETLHLIAHLKDGTKTISEYAGYDAFNDEHKFTERIVTVSFETVRTLAQKELFRRGLRA